MKLLTINELATLTRNELLALQELILTQILTLVEGTEAFAVAETNLENIRATLARRPLASSPRRHLPAP